MASPSLFLMPRRGYVVKDRKERDNAQQIPDFCFSASLVRPVASGAGPGGARATTGLHASGRKMVMVLSLREGPWWLSWWELPAARTGSKVAAGTPWRMASGAAWSALCIRVCVVLPKHSARGSQITSFFPIDVPWRKTSQRSWAAVGVV